MRVTWNAVGERGGECSSEVWALADLNLVALTGVATRDATLREKSSGQVKAEFSFEVERPFMRTTGEPVSDLFLVDVWQDLGKWTAETIKEGQRLFIVGTLNKESYSTRGGREHLTIVKAKYIRRLEGDILDGQIDVDALKQDTWPPELLRDAVQIVDAALREESMV